MVHIYTVGLYSAPQEGKPTICEHMDGPGDITLDEMRHIQMKLYVDEPEITKHKVAGSARWFPGATRQMMRE